MNLDHLRAFLEVAGTGNFNRAAERLHVTQSTISARIKALEDQLGQPLFVRNRSGAQLTAAGHRIRYHAEMAVRAWEQARQEVSLPDGLSQSIGLGVQVNLWERVVPRWLDWMRAYAPETALRVEADYSESMTRQVADGLLDLAILYVPRNLPGLLIDTLFEDSLVLVATQPRSVQQGWVEDYVFVDWGDEFRSRHALAFPRMQTPAITVGLSGIGLQYILRHGGAGYIAEHTAAPLIAEGSLFRVGGAPVFSRPAYLVRAEASPNVAAVELALAGLRASLDAPRVPSGDVPREAPG